MPLEFTDNELVEVVREKQHDELLAAFLQFIQYAKSGEAEQAIISALNNQSEKLSAFMQLVSSLKIEAPPVVVQPTKVTFNADPIMAIVKDLQKTNEQLIKAVKELNETNKADREFIPKYGQLNRLEKIIVSIKK